MPDSVKRELAHETRIEIDRFILALIFRVLLIILAIGLASATAFGAEAPKFVEKDGRWALLVDGEPYLILGGQVHNSSAWPSELPAVWKSLAELHANTVEIPAYWNRLSLRRGSSIGIMLTPS